MLLSGCFYIIILICLIKLFCLSLISIAIKISGLLLQQGLQFTLQLHFLSSKLTIHCFLFTSYLKFLLKIGYPCGYFVRIAIRNSLYSVIWISHLSSLTSFIWSFNFVNFCCPSFPGKLSFSSLIWLSHWNIFPLWLSIPLKPL